MAFGKPYFKLLTLILFGSNVFMAPTSLQGGQRRSLVFFGDSLTVGFGVDLESAYPALIQEKIKDAGLPFDVKNAGLTGETTSAGLRRLDWVLSEPVDVIVIVLGQNDAMRGVPIQETEKNFQLMIEKIRGASPKTTIALASLETFPNLGDTYTTGFKEMFKRIAKQENVKLVEFSLRAIAAKPGFLLFDGIHPNEKGYQVLADRMWPSLLPLLKDTPDESSS